MMLIGKYRERQKDLHCVFVRLVKEYDRMSKEEIIFAWGSLMLYHIRVRVVKGIYERLVEVG